jgi:nucleoid-associated protein YgaU
VVAVLTAAGDAVTAAAAPATSGRILALPMPYRSPARYLAPAALLAVAVVFIAILSSGGGSQTAEPSDFVLTGSAPPAAPSPAAQPAAPPAPKRGRAGGTDRTYVVQPGDTFAVISSRTGVAIEQIQRLNPGADSSRLTVGQKLRLPE